jgi:hypothetical protein
MARLAATLRMLRDSLYPQGFDAITALHRI